MNELNIASKIRNFLPPTPTSDQNNLLELLSEFILHSKSGDLMIINGYAGTGKTTMISALVRSLSQVGIKSVMIAPTGRAAKVMGHYSEARAYTIHKKIYKQKSALVESFVLDRNQDAFTYFIVDEASMISDNSYDSIFGSGNLLSDLVEYVNSGKGCRLIIVGDKAQLAPVGKSESPALETSLMEHYAGRVSYGELREVVRQSEGSAILKNATAIRTLIERDTVKFPRFDCSKSDFRSISGSDIFEELENAYSKYGKDETIIITRSNRQAGRLNAAIRSRVLCMEEELSSGDMIMVVKNNYHYAQQDKEIDFIANGDVAKIKRLRRYEELYGKRFVTATLKFPDYDDMEIECKVMLDTLMLDTPSLSAEQSRDLFFQVEADYADITVKKERYNKVREDSYFNALQIKFAYAVTCHKAQGGQWDCVFIDRMIFGDEEMSMDMLRWLYTAVTRAKMQVILVNFDERFM